MNTTKVNRQNLKLLCWRNGKTVAQVARDISRSRYSVYRAAAQPTRYPITRRLLEEALS